MTPRAALVLTLGLLCGCTGRDKCPSALAGVVAKYGACTKTTIGETTFTAKHCESFASPDADRSDVSVQGGVNAFVEGTASPPSYYCVAMMKDGEASTIPVASPGEEREFYVVSLDASNDERFCRGDSGSALFACAGEGCSLQGILTRGRNPDRNGCTRTALFEVLSHAVPVPSPESVFSTRSFFLW